MRELSLKELSIVSGGQHMPPEGGGGFSPIAFSIGTGAVSGAGGYISGKKATNSPITKEGLLAATFTGGLIGFRGGPIKSAKSAIDNIGSNSTAGAIVSGVDNMSQKKSDNTNDDEAGIGYH